MATEQDKSTGSGSSPQAGEKTSKPEETEGEECRCKEVSKKKFPELLKLMLRDLAFWRKKDS